ncbi:MAG: GDSL-type esterase/lipase family protein [Oscillospiraceae bacterium]|nr:GDSL-type esterase/lipase family protein [Oscillospiraceae bacterium]
MQIKRILLSLAVCLTAAGVGFIISASAGTGEVAVLSSVNVEIDGRTTTFNTYEIRGERHIKLRDLAFTLNRTDIRFSVNWDSAEAAIIIKSGGEYRSVGGEMAVNGRSNKTASRLLAKLYIDDVFRTIPAYIIDGNYYFRLRQIAMALEIDARWDGRKYIIDPNPTQLKRTADAGQDYIDRIVFIGDSVTYGFQAYGVLSGGTQTTQVWTPENRTFYLFNQWNIKLYYPETSQNISVEEAVKLKKPEYLFITLGTNGISTENEAAFKAHYIDFVSRILETDPGVKIILNTMFPIARNYRFQGDINNSKIDKGNIWIYEIASELGVRCLDTNSILKDSEGWLKPEYESGDGLHLTQIAYLKVLDHIRVHAYK